MGAGKVQIRGTYSERDARTKGYVYVQKWESNLNRPAVTNICLIVCEVSRVMEGDMDTIQLRDEKKRWCLTNGNGES